MNKLLALLTVGLFCLNMFSQAQTIPAKTKSMGFEVNGGDDELNFIRGAYFTENDLAIRLGFGFLDSDKSEVIALSVGFRNYLEGKNEVKPFFGADLRFASGSNTSDADGEETTVDVDIIEIEGNFGFEYFFRENISLEANAGLKLRSTDSDGNDEEVISTFSSGAGYGVGAAVNIYF